MKPLKYLVAVCSLSLMLGACHASNADGPANSAPDKPTSGERAAAKTAAQQADDSNYVDPNAPAIVVTDSADSVKLARQKAGK